jgi:adenosylcobinamide-GDP ribazoletransferase
MENHPTPDAPAEGILSELRLAAAFLTRLPLPCPPVSEGALARSMRAFPVVGALIGLAGAALYGLLHGALPPFLAATVAVAGMVWLTGALHEDGLADVADGFGGGRDRERKLEIMRDSRIGSYGVLALVFAAALRVGAVAAQGDWAAAGAALIAAGAVSRGLLPGAMALMDPARADGLAAGAGKPDEGTALTALGFGLLAAVACLGIGGGVLACLLAAVAAAVVGVLAARQIGGHTGDVLGAMQQAAEAAVLIAAVMMA